MFTRTVGVPVIAALSACVPPDPVDLTHVAVNVEASQVTGALTLTGGSFPVGPAERGDLVFQGAHTDDLLVVGQTSDQGYDTMVVDGSYDFHYRKGTGGAVVPANALAELISDRAIAGNAAIPIDVGAVAISAAFTLNGAAFPASQYDRATFYLQPIGTDTLIPLGQSQLASAPVMVVPGTYHVIYDYQQGSISPINRMSRVRQNVVLAANQQLQVNVVSSQLRLSVSLNGSPFPVSEYDDANIYLRDELTLAESLVMNTHDGATTVNAIDGTYDVVYRHETGDAVPLNTAAVVVNDFVLNGGGALIHDISAVTIDANVTLNKGPFPVSEYDDGIIALHDRETGTDTELGNTHSPFTDLVLIPGTYDVLFSHETGDDVPQNKRGIVVANVAIANADLIVQVVGIDVGTDITLNGAAFPASEYNDASFVLAGSQSVDDIVIGNSHEQAPSVMVMPGTYDLYYRHETGNDVPRNANHRMLANQVLATDTILSTNLETRFVRLSATLNDAPFPGLPANSGSIFAATHEGDGVLLLQTHGVEQTPMLITGDYELYYQHTAGALVPANPWARVGQAAID